VQESPQGILYDQNNTHDASRGEKEQGKEMKDTDSDDNQLISFVFTAGRGLFVCAHAYEIK